MVRVNINRLARIISIFYGSTTVCVCSCNWDFLLVYILFISIVIICRYKYSCNVIAFVIQIIM